MPQSQHIVGAYLQATAGSKGPSAHLSLHKYTYILYGISYDIQYTKPNMAKHIVTYTNTLPQPQKTAASILCLFTGFPIPKNR